MTNPSPITKYDNIDLVFERLSLCLLPIGSASMFTDNLEIVFSLLAEAGFMTASFNFFFFFPSLPSSVSFLNVYAITEVLVKVNKAATSRQLAAEECNNFS